MSEDGRQLRLLRPVDRERDHVRGGDDSAGEVTVLIYGDYLCPYCRRLKGVLDRLRRTFGQRMTYVFRHFPNEHAHPGAEFASEASEAAARQGKFWEMHDTLFSLSPPLTQAHVRQVAREIGLDMARFERDMADPALREHVQADVADGRRNKVTATPTIFVDGQLYDGAWDFYSMLEALERPLGARVQRTARAFAALPASAGIVLLAAAALALVCANTPLAGLYHRLVEAPIGVGATGRALSLTAAEWCSDGLLTLFFLLVGLEIRREVTAGALSDLRAAVLPVVCSIGGVLAPAAVYLTLNQGATAPGWSAPTSTGIAFTLGVLAVLGSRAPVSLKVFVAALAVIDDILSMLTLAIFYPQDFHAAWLIAAAAGVAGMYALNRWRIYAGWPYLLVTAGLWLSLHAAGLNAALSGVVLAAFLPRRPAPAAGPLLAQAATALSALEHAETKALAQGGDDRPTLEQEPIWDWASRNLSAASARLLSPADRVERAISPWAAFVVLPLFAFTATGVPLDVDLSSPDAVRILAGVILGLVVGKPLGVCLAAFAAVASKLGAMPENTRPRAFLGAAMLCGVSDPVALLMADEAFPHSDFANVAKIGVLIGSVVAALLGAAVLATSRPAVTEARA